MYARFGRYAAGEGAPAAGAPAAPQARRGLPELQPPEPARPRTRAACEPRGVSWPGVLLALLVSHAVGDVLLQTERQALAKSRGLRDARARRALATHIASYTLAFVPALVWIALESDAARAIEVAAVVALTHLAIDEGSAVRAWTRKVKGTGAAPMALLIAVDQVFHTVCLLGAALLAVS